jgi:hypothetical protein
MVQVRPHTMVADEGRINPRTNNRISTVSLFLRAEVPGLGLLSRLLKRIGRFKNISSAVFVTE